MDRNKEEAFIEIETESRTQKREQREQKAESRKPRAEGREQRALIVESRDRHSMTVDLNENKKVLCLKQPLRSELSPSFSACLFRFSTGIIDNIDNK